MAMKREKQLDMFDVAIGSCTLEDYLCQRYNENDLSSTLWIDPKDEVDELRAPKPLPDGQPGTQPEVIPVQGPRVSKTVEASSISVTPQQVSDPFASSGSPSSAPTVAPETSSSGPLESDARDSLKDESRELSPGPETFHPDSPALDLTSKVDSFQTQKPGEEAGEHQGQVPPISPPGPASMQELLERFHQAAKEYQQRSESGEVSQE